jgi:acetate kinase
LVYSGDIGENPHEIRTRICDDLEFLGFELDELKNKENKPIISKDKSKVKAHVIKTNEELMIAKKD